MPPITLRCHSGRLKLACLGCGTTLIPGVLGLRCPGCGRDYVENDGVLTAGSGEPSTAPSGYDPHFFPGIEELEERHFWFRVRRRLILDRLRRHVERLSDRALFDIGCGAGGLLGYLQRNGVPVAGGCDVYPEALARARQSVTAPLILVDEAGRPPLATGQTLISMFDVLEHLDDDCGVLAWLSSVLAPGGVIVLTVPAHPFLYDEKDRLSHHRRRYARRELCEKLTAAGLVARRVEHFMALMVLPRILGRFLTFGTRQAGPGPATLAIVPVVNAVMHIALEAERLATLRGRPLFGTSLLAIAERRP